VDLLLEIARFYWKSLVEHFQSQFQWLEEFLKRLETLLGSSTPDFASAEIPVLEGSSQREWET
jgi:hypothetical protein